MLEICSYSVEACIAAQRAGANRIELCSGFAEGGLTPSAGAMKLARKYLQIDCFAMIRPRGGDFCYSETEISQMRRDIEAAKLFGMDGVVFGILQPNGHVNITLTRELVQLAAPLKVTFHRAFDLTSNPFEALDDIIVSRCHTVLTSGQRNTALEGLDTIKELVRYADGRIDIMAGSGVSPSNASLFIDAGVQALHLSATLMKDSKMIYRNENVSIMQATSLTDYNYPGIDEQKVLSMAEIAGGNS